MGFKAVILVVNDVIKSKTLYQTVFDMQVIEDHGIYNVAFSGGLSLYQKELFENISKVKASQINGINISVYFEYADIDKIYNKVKTAGLEFIHTIEEQPWGQLVFRAYDYDNHILEVSEDMTYCLIRLFNKNKMSIQEIAIKTGYTEKYVKETIDQIQKDK